MKHAVLLFSLVAAFQFGTPQSVGVKHLVPPMYPPMARTARVQGDVVAKVTVTPGGTVKDVTIESGHPMLKQAVIDSVKQWTFICSACSAGDYVERIKVKFVLDDYEGQRCPKYVTTCYAFDLPDSVEVNGVPITLQTNESR